MKTWLFGISFMAVSTLLAHAFEREIPAQFDLRNVDGKKMVSAVKNQSGGTCWTHGTMAALEGNLFLTGLWNSSGETGEPNLAEYHLDWWNGFNQHFNADIAPAKGGLTVHEGGDYRVAAAYLARGGAVRDVDAQSFSSAPKENDAKYRTFYVRDIVWYSAGSDLKNINAIKEALMRHGVMGTALNWNSSFYSSSKHTFYEPPTSTQDPNHAVAIVGWDDAKVTQAPKPGAWLIKNSWGTGWGDGGYFWISYYDKVAGQHPEMGAISFQQVEPLKYHQIYSHDYHGWRATQTKSKEALNAFVAKGNANGKETLKSVSFYTTADDVHYVVKVFSQFDGTQPDGQLSHKEGIATHQGLHTVDLDWPVSLSAGEKFYLYLSVSDGGLAYDQTSDVPVLLGGGDTRVIVKSKATAGESFYKTASGWVDLTKDEATANFCIKGLSVFE